MLAQNKKQPPSSSWGLHHDHVTEALHLSNVPESQCGDLGK